MELSRRDLFKMGGAACLVAGASVALAGCGAGQANKTASTEVVVGAKDINFTEETEVLILGTGITGLAAAMAPIKAGKKVMLVEKLPIYGGESKLSCGFMFFSGSDYQIANGIKGTVEEAWEASKERLTVSKTFTESWYGDWIKKRHFGTTSFINTAINDYGATMQKPASPEVTNLYTSMLLPDEGIGNPISLMDPIRNGLEKAGAVFKFDTKAEALIKDSTGAIIGVRCIDQLTGEKVDIKAAKVAICTGGFSCNQEMVAEYLPAYAQVGNLTVNSMGEGQLLGFAAGAKQYSMELPAYMMGSIPQATTWGYFTPLILVTQDGKRFINEGQSHDSGEAALKIGFDGWWVIFDESAWSVPQIATSVKANVESNPDRYVTADTIEGLAAAMKVDVETMTATFNNHNAMATAGEDTEFKKTRHLRPLQGKLHALRLSTRRYKTYGGFLTSVDCEVLDDKDSPIPNLYAAGSTVPWSTSDLSPNAGNGYACGEAMAAALGA
jgi:fumarate reductase flavoprotein subunit